jgi:hypothetical protein
VAEIFSFRIEIILLHLVFDKHAYKKCVPLTSFFVSFCLQETGRREAFAGIAAAGAALVPVVANAAAGESPRFSVFGLLGDGTSYSEGAAYGSDQSKPLYSPYSVYGEAGSESLFKEDNAEYIARKKAILVETKKRMAKLPAYAEKKKWFEVTDELSRYMYETRGAVRYLAKSVEQKEAATEFFQAMEEVANNARLKRQDACLAAIDKSQKKLDALTAKL